MTKTEILQSTSDRILVTLALLTVAAATYFLDTASGPIVPFEVPFGFVRVLPPQYWILLAVTLLLLAVATMSRRLPYLWLSAITLTAIVPSLSDLINPYPRDIFATIATEYISRSGAFNPTQYIFLNFPGSEIVFSSIVVVTKIDPVLAIRAYGLLYNLLLLGLCYVAFRRFGISQIAALLGSLTFTLGFYTEGLLIFSSLNGFLFYILVASLVLAPFANRKANIMLLTLFFAAMTVTHAFSPFLTIAGVVGVMLGGMILGRVSSRRSGVSLLTEAHPQVNLATPIIFLLIATTFWAYVAFGPFAAGLFEVSSVNLSNLFERITSPLLFPQTPYETSYANFARLYAPVLFAAFVVYVLTVRDKRKTEMALLMVGLVGTVAVAVAGYAEEFLTRIFAFALLPLCYGVAKLFDSNRRRLKVVAIVALALVLGLHIPAHYGQDVFQVYPSSTIHGMQFLAEYSHPNSTFDSTAEELGGNYYYDVYRANVLDQQTGGFYYVLSYGAASWEMYSQGDRVYAQLYSRLDSSEYKMVYSNGLFVVYS